MKQAVFALAVKTAAAMALLGLGCSSPVDSTTAASREPKAAEGKPHPKTAQPSDADDTDGLIQQLGGKVGGNVAGRAHPDDVDALIQELGDKVPEPAPKKEEKPAASASPGPFEPATRAAVQLPRYFDQLDLSEEQKDNVSRVAQAYDTKIAELKRKLEAAKNVRVGTTGMIVALANSIKKLTNRRQQELEDLLTDKQRDKLRQLRAGK